MIDASIPLQVKPFQQPDQLNMMAQVLGIKQAQNQNELAQYGLSKAKRLDGQTNALMAALPELDLATPEGQRKALTIAPEAAQSLIKSRLDNANTQAQTDERRATTAEKTLTMHRNQLANVTNPQTAAQWTQMQYQDPIIGPILSKAMPLEAAIQSIPQDPQKFQEWRMQQALGMTEFIKQNKPTIHTQNTGQVENTLAIPGLGGPAQVVSSVQKVATPGEVMTDQRTRQEGALNRGQQKTLHDDTIRNENLRAGVTSGGGLDDNAERTAQAIASGQLPAPTGMALLNPKNQRILGRVMEINPQYDATTTAAKKAAAVAFTSGKEAGMMRSLQVAGQHLDQLGQLADAMNNGNMQLVNKIGNVISQQTGSPAVTNFDGAKEIVAKEVMKSIVAGGGGVNEREELARSLSNAKSPAQLKGVIQQYRNLMAAQHDALLQQRDAAGLPRSTLPNYTESAPTAGGVPPDIAAILQKHGGK